MQVDEQGEVVGLVDTDVVMCFRSKTLVMANGGVQGLHPELFNWFPNLDREKTIASDAFLRSHVYKSTM